MKKSTSPQPPPQKVHLKTRKSQLVSQKIRDDFYTFDSMPRFFMKKQICNPENKKSLSRTPERRAASTFDSLFQRTSPDGFHANSWKKKAIKSPQNKPSTPKFHSKKKVQGGNDGFSELLLGRSLKKQEPNSEKKEEKRLDYVPMEQRTGKKVLRLDNKNGNSLELVRGMYQKFMAYKNSSNVFENVKQDKDGFVTEYAKNFRAPEKEAYSNEGSPFKKIFQ